MGAMPDEQDHWEAAQEGADRLAEGDTAGAIAELTALLARQPDNAEAYFFLGCAWYEAHDYPQALRAYVGALELVPEHLGARIHAGHSLRMLGRYNEAIRMGKQILAQNQHDPDALYLMGASHFARGDNARATELLNHFLQTRPEPEVALEVEGMLQVLRGQVQAQHEENDN